MNRRSFLKHSMAATASLPLSAFSSSFVSGEVQAPGAPNVAVLLVDTDRVTTPVDERIYGQFLEHINHSVEDGLFAEQIRGAGFEGEDFKTYWESSSQRGAVEIADVEFKNGSKSVRLRVNGGRAAVRQDRIFLDAGVKYGGSLWYRRETGSPRLNLFVQSSKREPIASIPLAITGSEWQEAPFAFTSPLRDTQASIEIIATGNGALLLDFISMMRADVRRNGMLRPDLLEALRGLRPRFIRWPGGSFASTYKWKEGIGPYA